MSNQKGNPVSQGSASRASESFVLPTEHSGDNPTTPHFQVEYLIRRFGLTLVRAETVASLAFLTAEVLR